MRIRVSIAALLATLNVITHANAATTSANFNAHVKLLAACNASATALDFGSLSGMIQGTETATSTLTVTCSTGTPYSMTLQAGSGAMTGQTKPTDKVNYNAILVPTSSTGTGSAQVFTINGSLPAQTTPSAQDYQEARTVNINY